MCRPKKLNQGYPIDQGGRLGVSKLEMPQRRNWLGGKSRLHVIEQLAIMY